MGQHRIGKHPLRKRTLATLIPLLWACGAAAAPPAPAADAAAKAGAPCACHGNVYSVINLDPEGGAAAFLNEKGRRRSAPSYSAPAASSTASA